MSEIKFNKADELPNPINSTHDGVWLIADGANNYKHFIISGGVVRELITMAGEGDLTLEQARQNGNILNGNVKINNASLYTGGLNNEFAEISFLDDKKLSIRYATGGHTGSIDFNHSAVLLSSDDATSRGLVGNRMFVKGTNRNAFAQMGDLEDALSNGYIPLSGTELGKPLTGNIEVDTTNDNVGLVSSNLGLDRTIGITDDGYVTLSVISETNLNYLDISPQGTGISASKSSEFSSLIYVGEDDVTLKYIEQLSTHNNTAEIVVGKYGTITFNSILPDDDWNGFLKYSYEDGLYLGDRNSDSYLANLTFGGINAKVSGLKWSIFKDTNNDTQPSHLIFPDSGTTKRRIPVSVNGNFADQQGNIEVSGASQNLLETLANGNIADDTGNGIRVITFYNSHTNGYSSIFNRNGQFGLQASGELGDMGFYSSNDGWNIVDDYSIEGFQGITGDKYYGANYTANTYVQKKYVDDFYQSIQDYDESEIQTLKHIKGVLIWVTD